MHFEYLSRNNVNLVDNTADADSNERLRWCRDYSQCPSALHKYLIVASNTKNRLDNANDKVQAWTESLEAEASNALSKFLRPVSAGMHNKMTHASQVFARHRGEPHLLRERDGFFISLANQAALLVSIKARFGRAEQNELVADLTGEKFVLADERTLPEMSTHYPQLRGVKE